MTYLEPPEPLLRLTLDNAAWSWWTWPRVTQLGQTIFVGSAGSNIKVDETDLRSRSTRTWHLSDLGGDDHNNPAIITRPGMPAIAIYSRHAKDAFIRVRRGLQPVEDGFGPLGPERLVEAPRDRVTYAVAHVVGDAIHLWFRCGRVFWAHTRSDDWGVTWSTPKLVFEGDDMLYCAFGLVGSVALVVMTTHPHWSGSQSMHTATVDYKTGIVLSNGSHLGELGKVIELSALRQLAAPRSGYRTWVYDVSERGALWASFDRADMAATGAYQLTDWEGITMGITPTGRPFLDDGRNFYAGGAQFGGNPDTILVSRHDGQRWVLERYGAYRISALLAESEEYGIPVRAWPVLGGDGVAVNMIHRFLDFRQFDSYIGHLGGDRVRPSEAT